jgi:hypothetical protein
LLITFFGWHAKLEHIADPQVTPLDTTAPWYFLWLQGLLKLGNKTLMGIIIPGIIVLLLLAVPYIDRNPYRSMYKRPFAVAAGLLFTLALLVLTYMGTPHWGIHTDAATRILQDMAPMEGVGPLRATPFEQLQTGTYIVNQVDLFNMCPSLDFGCPDFEEAFTQYTNDFNASVELRRESGNPEEGLGEPAEAVMLVEDWQQDLKKVTMRINSTEGGKINTTEKIVYIHRERGSE